MPSDGRLDLGRVRLAAFDVDGVLTDGRFTLFSDGRDGLRFHTRDGLGLRLLLQAGIPVALLTGRRAEAVRIRGRALGIPHILLGVEDKALALAELAGREGVDPSEVLFLGDDLPDLPAMAFAGFPVAVADAAPEVRERAILVTRRRGGRGAVREVAERILKDRGRWDDLVDRCSGAWQ